MFNLGGPLGWTEEDGYRENIDMQDTFMEELNIPTYNNFEHFLFYDVIQALVKVYQVNHLMQERAREELGEEESLLEENSVEDPENGSTTPKSKKKQLPIDSREKLVLRLEFEFEILEDEK